MEENNIPSGEESDGIIRKSSFKSKLENFWYHYKWHSIVAAFLIITILICSFQMCKKESYDIHILYSGSYYIDRKSGSDIPEYLTFTSSLKRVCPDFDGNGSISPNLLDLFVLSPEQIEEEEKNAAIGTELNYALLNEDSETLEYQILYGNEYYVCFISEYTYNKYKVIDDVKMFLPLSEYAPTENSFEYFDENAIYLNSTPFSSLGGFENLPDDTLICLRSINYVSSFLNRRQVEKSHSQAIEVIKNILAFTPEENS